MQVELGPILRALEFKRIAGVCHTARIDLTDYHFVIDDRWFIYEYSTTFENMPWYNIVLCSEDWRITAQVDYFDASRRATIQTFTGNAASCLDDIVVLSMKAS
jgi:hypothetical protein